MKALKLTLFFLLAGSTVLAQTAEEILDKAAAAAGDVTAIQSQMLKTAAGEMILAQEIVVEASLARVWEAYTTSAGWMAWAAPRAEVDLRAGGTIRTHYGAEASIGDPGTNTLHIVNYVPEKVLTLRAEISDRWPEVMKEDAGNLMNVILFDARGETETLIRSYGVGYRDLPAYDELMDFFIPANEGLFEKLKEHLEESPPAR